jgi:MFS family permease
MSSEHALEHGKAIPSLVPARMDRLPWTKFHWMIVVGLGVSWILDGLEIQLVSLVGNVLKEPETLHLTTSEVGLMASIYLAGEVVGALLFGRMTDRLGRRSLFIVTLLVYLIASGAAGLSWDLASLLVFRFIAGMGIGGEYAAINSAIDELIPSKYRGRVDIGINGTYWGGALIGSAVGLLFLNTDIVAVEWGWRLCFLIGPVMGLVIIYLRRHIPESPRWLLTHGRAEEAERTVDEIEERVRREGGEIPEVDDSKAILVKAEDRMGPKVLWDVFVRRYGRRTVLGLTMMVTQSFLYNAIFFTYALVLTNFYGISKAQTSLYFLPFAAGNLLGPLLLGHLFDTIGRRKMIFSTYTIAGLVLLVSAWAFHAEILTATTHTMFWCVSFFFASAGASAAYLTVSEIFPLEVRGQAISYFFVIAQCAGAVAPVLYGTLIGEGKDRMPLTWGYVAGAVIMIIGGIVALAIGIDAERKSLEDIADPLSKVSEESGARA